MESPMKNKIKEFSKGNFKVEQPDIRFSETKIYMAVSEGEMYEGSFLIQNQKDGNIRGLVYPSSFRVHCLEDGFDGNPVCVNYTFDSTGLLPGQVEQGKFTVVCNGGEYDLDFTAIVEKPYIMTAYGKVQTVEDFRKLAIQDFGEANRLFRSRQFLELLKYEDKRIKNLYRNMRTWSLDEQALEEFLVGIKQKEKIFLSLSVEKQSYQDVLESQKGIVEISKNIWGHLKVHVRAEGDFLNIQKTEFNTDDFVGNKYRLEYIVSKEQLHAGYNYGKIYISTPYETLCVDVTVYQSGSRDEMRGMKGLVAGQGLKEYLSFVSGSMSTQEWVEKALKRVEQLQELEPASEYYMLLKAHVCLRGNRQDEARWILENGNFPKFAIGRKAEIHAYYLYLMALLKQETLYTNRVLEEINRTFMKHPYSWQLLCMLVNLDPMYRDEEMKIRVLERQYFNGSNQVLLYAEAYICFQENVTLLRKLDSFEVQILNFATKYKIITRELALRAADIISQQKKYDVKFLRILERAYEMYEEPRILQAICMQLIKGNKAGYEYFSWYEKAAKQEMMIAQLYEYYMMSVNPQRVKGAFPRIVYLYFLHGINLDYKRTALLYENILTYEDEEGEIYKRYYEQMKAFAKENLLRRHINESLRVIYKRFLNPNSISLEELDALYDICHAYQVTTDVKGIKYVIVIEEDGGIRQRVPYRQGVGAKIYLYDKDARIIWEADNGVRYVDSILYETRRPFYEMRYLELCKNRRMTQAEARDEQKKTPVTFEMIRQYGVECFDKQEVFVLCSKRIREQEQTEDDLLLYTTFAVLKEGFFDKATLTYLAQYYCGATSDMKVVWKQAREYGVYTKAIAERIITQMLFSETMFAEEEIFEDYYMGKPYFRLKQAYFAYVSRMHMVKGRRISSKVIRMMMHEMEQKEYLADICKVTVLKYFAQREKEPVVLELLKGCFEELCRKNLVFPFYLKYPQEWLRETQLYDKVLVEYHGTLKGKVKIYYRIQKEGELLGDFRAEALLPMYDCVYMKEFVLYENETLTYYFEETTQDKQITTSQATEKKENVFYEAGKYGRLNLIALLSKDKQYEAMLHYKKEEQVAESIFRTY